MVNIKRQPTVNNGEIAVVLIEHRIGMLKRFYRLDDMVILRPLDKEEIFYLREVQYMKKKVAIYIRVSTEEQAREGYSLPAQERALRDYASNNGYEVFKVYADEGVSGRTIKKRKQMQQMLTDAKEKKYDLVLIYKLDRLSRSVRDAYSIIENLIEYDIGLISLTESHIKTETAQDRAVFGVSMVFSQLEVEQTSERVAFGMKEAFNSGKIVTQPPFGYRVKDHVIEIIEDEAELVREIFSLYLNGHGYSSIASILNKRGIHSSRRGFWSIRTIGAIIKNKSYVGCCEINFKKTNEILTQDNYFPPIISKEDFLEAQHIRTHKITLHPQMSRMTDDSPIFSSVLRCSCCGARIATRGKDKFKRRRYRCFNAMRGVCKSFSFFEYLLEESFIKAMIELTTLQTNNTIEITEKLKNNQRILMLKKELKSIADKKQKNYFAWENDLIDVDFFTKRSHELLDSEKQINEELTKLEASSSEPKLFELKIKNFEEMWNGYSVSEKKKFLMNYIDTITLDVSYPLPSGTKAPAATNNVTIVDITFK